MQLWGQIGYQVVPAQVQQQMRQSLVDKDVALVEDSVDDEEVGNCRVLYHLTSVSALHVTTQTGCQQGFFQTEAMTSCPIRENEDRKLIPGEIKKKSDQVETCITRNSSVIKFY